MKRFCIKNYKNLKDLTLDNLSKVNLIIGKNNVGKSTLLEALALYASGGSSEELLNILRYSGENLGADNESHFLSIFNRASFIDRIAPRIEFCADTNAAVELEVRYQKEIETRSGTHTNVATEYLSESEFVQGKGGVYSHVEKGLTVRVGNSFGFIPFRGEINTPKEVRNHIFVRPVDYFLSSNAELFDSIALTEKEDTLLEALRIIDPTIVKINYLASEPGSRKRSPFVVLNGASEKILLASMGDGISRILTIILSLLNCPPGGLLLLDEIDAGLHFSVQKQLWEMIWALAHKQGIQVFATTHSLDCVHSFSQVIKNDGLLIRLDSRSNGGIVPTYYSNSKDILFAIEKQIELR